jgi:hypothetical protein
MDEVASQRARRRAEAATRKEEAASRSAGPLADQASASSPDPAP